MTSRRVITPLVCLVYTNDMNNNYICAVLQVVSMSTHQPSAAASHRCGCGETFESTEALLQHAREVHRFSPL